MKVVYFGTPQFAANVLIHLLKNDINVVAVVTKPDKAQGRSTTLIPTPVKTVAEAHSIPIFQPEIISSSDYIPVLQAFDADLFVVVAYGEIIKSHLLTMPKIACINLHASLLPHYRGAAPIQRSILNGEKETGITIIHMAKKMDAGDMISTQKVSIGPTITFGELEEELCTVGSSLLLKTIRDFQEGIPKSVVQDHSQATFAPKIELEDCEIDWNQPAQKIHDLVRGVNPSPGAWCKVNIKGHNKRLKIMKTLISSSDAIMPAAKILSTSNGIEISCGHGSINLLQIQLEGKKMMPAKEFIRGLSMDALQFITH